MSELLQQYWILVVVALVIGVLVAWWIFHASRRTTIEREEPADAAMGTKRNQALIDSPPAAKGDDLDSEASRNLIHDNEDLQSARSDASPGAVSAAANNDATAAAGADADAEAGAAVPAREAMKAVPAEAASRPAPQAEGAGDDLGRIKGVGPKLVAILHENGITSFAQIAAWDDTEIDRVDGKLGRFQGRIRRDDWVEQARLLDAGDTAAYEDRFGKL